MSELEKELKVGASFTWSTKAFGSYVGWMCGWGMVVATIIVLSNLAAIAVEFFYLFIARVVNNPDIANLAGNKLISPAGASPPASTFSTCSSGSR